MTPFYTDDWLTLYGGDCREVLASLPADSVDCVVTSPPYWGLRDYGTATWEGGDAECDHRRPNREQRYFNGRGDDHGRGGTGSAERSAEPFGVRCGKCGAVRIDSQLGLERTPEEYVANLVQVFAEVRRVLKPSGTCWLNLGDSYNSIGGTMGGGKNVEPRYRSLRDQLPDLKPKDLVGIPWRVAFALQADGWYLRSDIIWSKPNPMPESVTDRPTKAHEYLFLLTKSARYYFDADAVRESLSESTERIHSSPQVVPTYGGRKTDALGGGHSGLTNGTERLAKMQAAGGRNIRSVWSIATRPYPGAHFAVFPPELPERCIKAGSSERGVCPECGAPWERSIEIVPRASGGREGRRSGAERTQDHRLA
jgi:DNA modification methylase